MFFDERKKDRERGRERMRGRGCRPEWDQIIYRYDNEMNHSYYGNRLKQKKGGEEKLRSLREGGREGGIK